MSDQSRIEKVQKLLALAERAGSQEEAELAYARAQDLMTKWMIDDAMLAASGQKVDDEIIRESVIIKRSSFFKGYQRLISGVAQANDVKVLWRNADWKDLAGVILIGWKSDIERVKMLYTSLLIQLSRERNRSLPEDVRNDGAKYVARWRNSFTMGYALTIANRLWDQKRRTMEQATRNDSTGSLLPAVRDRKGQVDAFFNAIPTKKARQSRMQISDAAGFNSGQQAAKSADLGNTRMGGTRKSVSR